MNLTQNGAGGYLNTMGVVIMYILKVKYQYITYREYHGYMYTVVVS